MGVARLLAKGWVLVCLFAGAHAVTLVLVSGADPLDALPSLIACVVLFLAMGLLFVDGYGASAGQSGVPLIRRFKPLLFVPGFNDIVFLVFVCLSFVNQIVFAPANLSGTVIDGFESAVYFAVPGQRALVDALGSCGLDGGRVFASAITWLLAVVFLCSSLSRLKHEARILRLERALRPDALGPRAVAIMLGIAAVIGLQLLFVGSASAFLPCSAYADLSGALLIGLAPLLLAYVILAALATALAIGRER
jgi:hypothetical protein